jgi:hypothetical protein
VATQIARKRLTGDLPVTVQTIHGSIVAVGMIVGFRKHAHWLMSVRQGRKHQSANEIHSTIVTNE